MKVLLHACQMSMLRKSVHDRSLMGNRAKEIRNNPSSAIANPCCYNFKQSKSKQAKTLYASVSCLRRRRLPKRFFNAVPILLLVELLRPMPEASASKGSTGAVVVSV
jgi:hypothetical protein